MIVRIREIGYRTLVETSLKRITLSEYGLLSGRITVRAYQDAA